MKKKENPYELIHNETKFREFVLYKLGQHDAMLHILLTLAFITLGGLITILVKLLIG